MATYKQRVSNVYTGSSLKWMGKAAEFLNDAGSMILMISSAVSTAKQQEEKDLNGLKNLLSAHQEDTDTLDKVYSGLWQNDSGYVDQNRFSIDNISYNDMSQLVKTYGDVGQGYVLNEDLFNAWKQLRTYSSEDAKTGKNYFDVNVVEGNIGASSNYETRNEEIYQSTSDYITDNLATYLYGDSDLDINGQLDEITKDKDYTQYQEKASSIIERIDANWISDQYKVPLWIADRWMSENYDDLKADLTRRVNNAQYNSQIAQIELSVENAKSNLANSMKKMGFNEAYDLWSSTMQSYGASSLPGFDAKEDFVEFADIYINSAVESIIDANPETKNSDIENYVNSYYDEIRKNNEDLYSSVEAQINQNIESRISSLKSYKDRRLKEAEDDFQKEVDGVVSNLAITRSENPGAIITNNEIYSALGVDPNNLFDYQKQILTPVIEDNNRKNGVNSMNANATSVISNAGQNSALSNTEKRRGIITVEDTSIDEQLYSDSVAKSAEETRGKQQYNPQSAVEQNEGLNDVLDSLSEAGLKTSNNATDKTNGESAEVKIPEITEAEKGARAIEDQYYDRQLTKWLNTGASANPTWDGNSKLTAGQDIIIEDLDAFDKALNDAGIDRTNPEAVYNAAAVFSMAYNNKTDEIENSQSIEERMAYLTDIAYNLTSEEAMTIINANKEEIGAEEYERLTNIVYVAGINEVSKIKASQYNSGIKSLITGAGYEEGSKEYKTLYNLFTDDEGTALFFNDLAKEQNNPDIDVQKYIDSTSASVFNKYYADQIKTTLSSFSFDRIIEDKPENVDRLSDGRADYIGWSTGEFQNWRFDKQWYDDNLIALAGALTNSDAEDFDGNFILDSAAAYLTGDSTMQYSDLSYELKNVAGKNASMLAYMACVPYSLAEITGQDITDSKYVTAALEETGDIALLDKNNGLVYTFATPGDSRNVSIFAIDPSKIIYDESTKSSVIVPVGARKTGTRIFSRSISDSYSNLMLNPGKYQQQGITEGDVSKFVPFDQDRDKFVSVIEDVLNAAK